MIDIIIFGILALGFLIIFHEMGHFFAAKRSGVKVNEFTIGFGPALWKKEKGGTLYALRLVPFGGAVVMEGEDEDCDSEGAFNKASKPRRLLILAAGSLMNLLIGFVILFFLFLPVQQYTSVTIETLMDGATVAAEAGFLPGDEFYKVDGQRTRLIADLQSALAGVEGRTVDYEIIRDGQKVVLPQVTLTKQEMVQNGETQRLFGFTFATKKATLLYKLDMTFREGVGFVELVFDSLRMLFQGDAGIGDMAGPVAITSVLSTVASQSMRRAFYFIAFISINLGVMNLLPLPALDGGRLLFLLIEAVRGKPVKAEYEGWVHTVGLILFFGLLVFITFNDIRNLSVFQNLFS